MNLFALNRLYIEQNSYYMTVQGAETAEFVSFLNSLKLLLTKQNADLSPLNALIAEFKMNSD
jgi:hypothetical protein